MTSPETLPGSIADDALPPTEPIDVSWWLEVPTGEQLGPES